MNLFPIKKFLLLSLISLFAISLKAEEKIRFYRPVAKAEIYRCEVKTELTEAVEVSSGGKLQMPQINYLKIELAGNLQIIKASSSSYPDEAELTIDVFSFSDGKTVSARLKQGSVIKIDFKGKKPEFTLKQNTDSPLTDDEIYALSVVFTTPKNKTLSDLLGKEKKLSIGDKWPLAKIPFITEFYKNGFTVAPEDLTAEACLQNKAKFLDIDCWEIKLNADVKNNKDLNFEYTSTMFLPVNDAFSGTLVYTRETFTAVKKILPANNPMSAGLIMDIKTTEKTYSASIKLK